MEHCFADISCGITTTEAPVPVPVPAPQPVATPVLAPQPQPVAPEPTPTGTGGPSDYYYCGKTVRSYQEFEIDFDAKLALRKERNRDLGCKSTVVCIPLVPRPLTTFCLSLPLFGYYLLRAATLLRLSITAFYTSSQWEDATDNCWYHCPGGVDSECETAHPGMEHACFASVTTCSTSPSPPTPTGTGRGTSCGNGAVGNGICANTSLCCSPYGWCGITSAHCGGAPVSTPTATTPTAPTSSPPNAVAGDDSRLIAYVGNWEACPTMEQTNQYTHILVSFAVTYQYNAAKNICDTSCTIGSPVPICNNSPNQALVDAWQAAGKKVILSFGGAGMGGSWAGDNNDCWEYCFGKEEYVLSQLETIVATQGFDGVDIDYEYHYDSQDQQDFLRTVTTGLRNALPAGKLITHAPMEPDMNMGTAYYNILKDVEADLDFIMPQYYNGYMYPKNGLASSGALAHYTNIVNDVFMGDATKVVFGFCSQGCGGFNTNGQQAATVMTDLNTAYSCNGGAFFWYR
jgi:chitinase